MEKKRKVPKDIINKMRKASALFTQANSIMEEIDSYFETKHPDLDFINTFRSGNGRSLEELEYGSDITDQFVEWYEGDNFPNL